MTLAERLAQWSESAEGLTCTYLTPAHRSVAAELRELMRQAGMTLQAIADQLNQQNTPTLRGGKQWRPSSVQAATGYRRPKQKQNQPRKPTKEGA